MTSAAYDAVIVGGGIVGSAIAAALAGQLSVVLVEGEPEFGVHASGRSAAILTQTYGSERVQELTAGTSRRASRGSTSGPTSASGG